MTIYKNSYDNRMYLVYKVSPPKMTGSYFICEDYYTKETGLVSRIKAQITKDTKMKIMYKQYRKVVNFDTLKSGDLFKWCNHLYVKCDTYHSMNTIRMEDGRQDSFTESHGVIPIEGTFVEE